MFLIGTEFALLIHVLIGAGLIIPPLIPQWKKLVVDFNEKSIPHKEKIFWVLMISGLILISISILSITFHHRYLFRLDFPSLDAEIAYFNFFALFTFFLGPFGLALIGISAYLRKTEDPRLGNFFILLLALVAMALAGSLALVAMALAGSFLHDILWCGTKTGFYMWEANAGYDIDWWLDFMRIASKDYRNLAFYMSILASILITYASILLYKHGKISEKESDPKQRKKIILFAAIAIANFGFWLYVMDYAGLYIIIWPFVSTYIGIPFSIVLFYYVGKNL